MTKWIEEAKEQYVTRLVCEFEARHRNSRSHQAVLRGLVALADQEGVDSWHKYTEIQRTAKYGREVAEFTIGPGVKTGLSQALKSLEEAGLIQSRRCEGRNNVYRLVEHFYKAVRTNSANIKEHPKW